MSRRCDAQRFPTRPSQPRSRMIGLRYETHCVLRPLRLHPVSGLEVLSRVGDEFRGAWVIDCLHADNGAHQPGTVAMNMLGQLGLCIGRPSNEDRTCICDGIRNRLQIGVILRGMPTADHICLVMNVPCRMIGMQNELLHIGWAEMEYPGLVLIDPDDGMIVMLIHSQDLFAGFVSSGNRNVRCRAVRHQCSGTTHSLDRLRFARYTN